MTHTTRLMLGVIFITFLSTAAFGQAQTSVVSPADNSDANNRFLAMRNEASFICGQWLPSQITGITEMMALCGGRFGLKMGRKTYLEPTFLAGAGKSQRYILGSASFRTDVQLDDLIGSMYIGPDIHYATSPVYTTDPVSSQTDMYFGGHIGGAIWWELTQDFYIRTDLQFNINPGTALFVGFSFVFRFNPGGDQEQVTQQ